MWLPTGGLRCAWRLAASTPPGWGVFGRVGDEALWIREAAPWDVAGALEGQSLRLLAVLGRDERGRCRACRPGVDPGPPVVVRLADGVDAFDELLAWFDGSAHWQVEARPDARASDLRARLVADLEPDAAARPGERALHRLARGLRLAARPETPPPPPAQPRFIEARLRRALELGGARLVRWSEERGGYVVTWTRDGETWTSVVGPDLSLREAGFCLAGTDRAHDLTSLASLVLERPSRHW